MDQGRRQGHPLPLAAGKGAHLLAVVGDAQLIQHALGLVFVQRPELLWEMEEHLLQHRGAVVHGRVLGQDTDLDIGVPGDAASVRFRDPCQDLQKGGLAGAVDADDAHLVPFIQVKIHILQQLAAAEIDRDVFRR